MSIPDDTSYYPSTGIIRSAVPVATRSEAEDFRARLEAARDALTKRDFSDSCKIATTLLEQLSLPIALQVAAHIIVGTSTRGQRSIVHLHEAVKKASSYLGHGDYQSFADRVTELVKGAQNEMNREAEEGKNDEVEDNVEVVGIKVRNLIMCQ